MTETEFDFREAEIEAQRARWRESKAKSRRRKRGNEVAQRSVFDLWLENRRNLELDQPENFRQLIETHYEITDPLVLGFEDQPDPAALDDLRAVEKKYGSARFPCVDVEL